VHKTPEPAVEQVLNMVLHKKIVSRHGKEIPCTVHTLCIHGDEPSAVVVAAAVKAALAHAGVRLVTLPEMNLA